MAGLDLGIKQDHSALVVLGTHNVTQRIRLADCQSWAPEATTGKIDLEGVQAAVLDAHRRFNLGGVWYDPYQCALMAQQLERAGVRMVERPFVGKQLDLMATTLLDVFRSKRIDLYRDERLIADLHKLTIVEKSFGYKLEAMKDKDGHADTAFALAIALPVAVEGSYYSGAGVGTIDGTFVSPCRETPFNPYTPKLCRFGIPPRSLF